ncbi:RloB family protein [Sporosarcina sp. FSL W7-1349]|uniref:RloB family protein n=1 Tax=Sporosarcina sp. FSL W7-1349 TaxID=2921561 RepID=UPI0030F60FE0
MLLITEGMNTEKDYFSSIKDHIQERFKSNLIIDKIDIDLEGTGRGTMEVVKYALKAKNRNTYSDVWVVFDRDDFTDFDEAIQRASDEGLSVAWSNRSFELWFLLHFQNVTSPMDNRMLTDRLSSHLQQHGIIDKAYSKSHKVLYNDLKSFLSDALVRCEKLMEQYEKDRIIVPSKMDPATTVHQLIKKLLPYID